MPTSELSLTRKDGTRIDVISSHAIVTVPGKPPELFCVDVDISQRKQPKLNLRHTGIIWKNWLPAEPLN